MHYLIRVLWSIYVGHIFRVLKIHILASCLDNQKSFSLPVSLFILTTPHKSGNLWLYFHALSTPSNHSFNLSKNYHFSLNYRFWVNSTWRKLDCRIYWYKMILRKSKHFHLGWCNFVNSRMDSLSGSRPARIVNSTNL